MKQRLLSALLVVTVTAGCAGAAAPPAAPTSIPPATSAASSAAPAASPAQPAKPAAGAAQPAASAAGTTAELQQVIEGARKEGSVVIVGTATVIGGTDGAKKLQDLINQKYGVELTINYTPGPSAPAVNAKIVQEVNAGQPAHTDLYYFVRSEAAQSAHVVDWRALVPGGLPESTLQYGGRVVQFVTEVPGITYNKNLVPANRVPKSLEDLLDPYWKGKIAAMPYLATLHYMALPEFWGHEKTISFVQKYSSQLGGLIGCAETNRIASGEFLALALDCGEYEARKAQFRGLPIAHAIPSEGGALDYFTAAVPLTAQHPNAAKLLISYMLTREGQDFLWENVGADLHKLPGSRLAPIITPSLQQGRWLDSVDLEAKYPQQIKDYEKEVIAILTKR